jgi:F0F1-type ATP synthase, delta subunit (mitochondrial oligomycin sensitivity protein)
VALVGKLYMAGPHDEKIVRHITKKFETLLGQSVEFEVERDQGLIGGFRAFIDGRLYDASVAAQAELTRAYLKGERQG